MPFELKTLVGLRNHILDGGPHPPGEGAIFLWGREVHPFVKYRDSLRSLCSVQTNGQSNLT